VRFYAPTVLVFVTTVALWEIAVRSGVNQELHRHRVEMPLAHGHRRAHAQQAARLLDAFACIGHRVAVVLQHAPCALVKSPTRIAAKARSRCTAGVSGSL